MASPNYKRLYLLLFNRCSDAIAMLESGQITNAINTLKTVQRDCEELYSGDGNKLIYFQFRK